MKEPMVKKASAVRSIAFRPKIEENAEKSGIKAVAAPRKETESQKVSKDELGKASAIV
jgi:hypothetical protein